MRALFRRGLCVAVPTNSIPPAAIRAALALKHETYVEVLNNVEDLQERQTEPRAKVQYLKALKRLGQLSSIAEKYEVLKGADEEVASLEEMLETADDGDLEMVEMVEEELETARNSVKELEENVLEFLVPEEEDDSRNAVLEIRAGAGGMEASLFVQEILAMYQQYAAVNKWKLEVLEESQSEYGGLKEVSALMSGPGVFGRMKYETGVHRVQRIPSTESAGRIHTSTVTVAALPEAEEIDVELKDSDLRIDICRASGPGGQKVNKTDSAVRITHIPTGFMAFIQDERCQHSNKAKAMKLIQARVYQLEKEKANAARTQMRNSQIGSGDRSERIRTYNYPQSRITDHRINLTLHGIEQMLRGELLDGFLTKLRQTSAQENLMEQIKNL